MIRVDLSPTAIYYSIIREGIAGFLVQVFSIIGGLYMIFKVVDLYYTMCFIKPAGYTEVSTGSDIEMADQTADTPSNSVYG